MTKTKIAAVLLGAGAGLIAGAPLAFAGDMPSSDNGGGDHGQHSWHHGHGDHGKGGDSCSIRGGNAGAEGRNGDALAGNILTQIPTGGVDAGNVVCSDLLSGNFSGNKLNAAIL